MRTGVAGSVMVSSSSITSKYRSMAVRASNVMDSRKPTDSIGQRSTAAVAKKALNTGWKAATGKTPPANPADPDVEVKEAVAWAAVSGALIGMAVAGTPKLPLPVPLRRLVLNDVGPAIQWSALQRIGAYLGNAGRFESVQQAADAMHAVALDAQ